MTLRVHCHSHDRSSGAVSSRPAGLRRSPDDGGFTLIEVLVATVVFAILSTAFAATLSATLRSFAASKARTHAEQLASSQLEESRRLDYAALGTVGGNPPGLLASSRTVADGGRQLLVVTRVMYVNDPVPNGVETGADYKSVRVTVTLVGSPTVLAQMSTLVAPATEPSLTKGLIKAQVVDYALNQPVGAASVTLGSGPSAPLADTTDAAGKTSFAALIPTTSSGTTSRYTMTVAAAGYETLPEDKPPTPAASTALAAGQVFTTVIRVFRPATVRVHLVDALGAPFTTAATISVSSSRGAGTVAATGTNTTVTTIAGALLIPSVSYTVGAFAGPGTFATSSTVVVPGTTTLGADVTLVMKPAATGQVQVTLRNNLALPIAGSAVAITGGVLGVALVAVSNSLGVAAFTVPAGITPSYTIFVPAQAGYAQATATTAGPIVALTIVALVAVPRP